MKFWENKVLFVDGEAMVIDKPAGLAVHPGARTPESLEDYLHHLRFGFKRRPLPVHRLDRDTSGCLLLARNPKAHKAFQRAFEDKKVGKTYVAILDGVPDAEEGTVDLALGKTFHRRGGLADGSRSRRQGGGDALAGGRRSATGARSSSSPPRPAAPPDPRPCRFRDRHPDNWRPGLRRG